MSIHSSILCMSKVQLLINHRYLSIYLLKNRYNGILFYLSIFLSSAFLNNVKCAFSNCEFLNNGIPVFNEKCKFATSFSIYLSIYLYEQWRPCWFQWKMSIYLSIYIYKSYSSYLSNSFFFNEEYKFFTSFLYLSLSFYLSLCLSVSLSIYLSIYLSISLTINQSIYLSIYLSI